jgi:acylglycerol lipase
MTDITHLVQSYMPPTVPLFLMGHSMGGQETLYWAITAPLELKKQISGFILSAPWIQLHPDAQPSSLKVKVGKLAAQLLPSFQLKNELDHNVLSHNKESNLDWKNDELCHDYGTLEGLAGSLGRADDLHRGVVQAEDFDGLRFLFVHGTEDKVTSHEATKKLVDRLQVKNKFFKSYEGTYHNSKSIDRSG